MNIYLESRKFYRLNLDLLILLIHIPHVANGNFVFTWADLLCTTEISSRDAALYLNSHAFYVGLQFTLTK